MLDFKIILLGPHAFYVVPGILLTAITNHEPGRIVDRRETPPLFHKAFIVNIDCDKEPTSNVELLYCNFYLNLNNAFVFHRNAMCRNRDGHTSDPSWT